MLRKCFSKLKSRAGFSLAEVLMAVVILLMVSAVVAAGIPIAANAYNKALHAANAQLLISTTMTELRDEIGTATEVSVDPDGTTVYFTKASGSRAKIYLSGTEGIRIREYIGMSDEEQYDQLLVSAEASNKELYVIYDSPVTYESGIVTFTGLSVMRGDGALADVGTFSVRVLTDTGH